MDCSLPLPSINAGEGVKKREPSCRECKLIQPLWRTVWRFLKKLKIELPHDPEISLLDRYPEKTMVQKDTCASVFTVALVTIATTQKAT